MQLVLPFCKGQPQGHSALEVIGEGVQIAIQWFLFVCLFVLFIWEREREKGHSVDSTGENLTNLSICRVKCKFGHKLRKIDNFYDLLSKDEKKSQKWLWSIKKWVIKSESTKRGQWMRVSWKKKGGAQDVSTHYCTWAILQKYFIVNFHSQTQRFVFTKDNLHSWISKLIFESELKKKSAT